MARQNKKKIVFFIKCNFGGAERITINIAEMLPKEKFDIVFVVVGKNKDIEQFIPSSYKVYHIRQREYRLLGIGRILYYLHKEKADIAFSSMIYINVRIILAAKILGIKAIVRNNNSVFAPTISAPIRLAMKILYPFAYKIIAQQDEMRAEIINALHVKPQKVVALQNPIKTENIDVLSKEPSPYENNESTNYLWVARFDRAKGQDILIRAFDIVHAKKPSANLYFVGSYNESNEIYLDVLSYMEKHNLKDCVHFVGLQDNPYKWVKNCTCFVMPSRIEGLPNALIEAMYLKRPVVGTSCIPVVNRIIKHGYNGYVVPVENPTAMAEAMLQAIDLKNFEMTYTPSSKEDFINLFE